MLKVSERKDAALPALGCHCSRTVRACHVMSCVEYSSNFFLLARDAALLLVTDLIGTTQNDLDLQGLVLYVPQFFNADTRDLATGHLRLILGDNANTLIGRLQAVPANHIEGFINTFQHAASVRLGH